MQLQFSQIGQVVEADGFEFAMLASQVFPAPDEMLAFFLLLNARRAGQSKNITHPEDEKIDSTEIVLIMLDGDDTLCGKRKVTIQVDQNSRVEWLLEQLEATVTDNVVSEVRYVDIAETGDYIAFLSQP